MSNDKLWKINPTPIDDIHKIEILVDRCQSLPYGIRMYNKEGKVIFTTGRLIEDPEIRNSTNWKLIAYELNAGERIIGVRSHDCGDGFSYHKDLKFVIGR